MIEENPTHNFDLYWDHLLPPNFEIPDEPPCYVQQCYVYVDLKVCLGVRCHIYMCRCTAIHNAHLWVLFSLGVSQNKEEYNVTVLDRYDSFITTMYLYYYNTIMNT